MSFYGEALDPNCKYYNDFEKGIKGGFIEFFSTDLGDSTY